MLKILRKKLDIILTGEIEIKTPTMEEYTIYVNRKIKEQKYAEILNFLRKTFPNPYDHSRYGLDKNRGYSEAIDRIANYLANQECEDE